MTGRVLSGAASRAHSDILGSTGSLRLMLSAICHVVFLCLARLPYVSLTDHSASGSSQGSPEVSPLSHIGHFSPVVKGSWAGSKT